MARHREQPSDGNSIEDLTDSITMLSQQIEVLRNVLDEFREHFSWAVRNERDTVQPRPFVLKRMAADPIDPRWADHLEIVHAAPTETQPSAEEGIAGVVESVERLARKTDAICGQLESVRERLAATVAPSSEPRTSTRSVADGDSLPGHPVQRSLFTAGPDSADAGTSDGQH